MSLNIYGDQAEKIVDSILSFCEAMEGPEEVTGADLVGLFDLAIKGGRQYASIKLTMAAWAIGRLSDTPAHEETEATT